MTKFFQHVLDVLRGDDRFFADDGTFLRNAVRNAAMTMDEKLLRLLLNDDLTRKKFFAEVNGIKIFDKLAFSWTINNRQFLPDSYTRYANKIGLADERDNFISATGNVSLVFPYKDCVLEGGQTSDTQKRAEIFYNELLAVDELDRLLEPKVFVEAVRYSADDVQPAVNFNDDDNLIIKGNNLLVLASLTKRFSGKVKCIYIDPPYNTGSDSFGYNDRFNHSTWLTFMKNRLDFARKLLRNDGSIWISIDDDEGHYLKVLCDEIFGRDNFVATVVWERAYAPVNLKKHFSKSHDYILVYAKNISTFVLKGLPRTDQQNKDYKNPDNDPRGVWKAGNPSVGPAVEKNIYEVVSPSGRKMFPPKGRSWLYSKEKFEELLADNRIWFGKDGNNIWAPKMFLSEVKQTVTPMSIWKYEDVGHTDESKKEIKALNLKELFGTPKPERLLERILTLATNAGDLVLDYHLGSGTTAAVAHKMGRRYIGVEQMDYVKTLVVERLKKVIGGEGGGISQKIGWKGGGSFVYCELAKQNQKFVEAIERADGDDLDELRRKIIATGFISCNVDPAQIDATAEEFAALTVADRKKFLTALLDKNLLYVNLSDLDDAEFAVADADKNFTLSFYFNDETTSPPTASAMAPKPTTAAIVRL